MTVVTRSLLAGLLAGCSIFTLSAMRAWAEGCSCCTDFSFHETRKIGAWLPARGSREAGRDPETAAINFARSPRNAAWALNGTGGAVSYGLVDNGPHRKD